MTPLYKVFKDVWDRLTNSKGKVEFLSTGFKDLDSALDGGFLKQELVVVGATPGTGKSFLAGKIMYNMAKRGFRCAYFSLELVNEMVVARMVGQIADVKAIQIKTNTVPDFMHWKVDLAHKEVSAHQDYMHFYDDMYELNAIRNEVFKNKFDFVIVDFIQNVSFPLNDEYSRLSSVSLELQKLAKSANCCILVLSQLSNATGRNMSESAPPEFKGSGAIAAVADLGFFLQRDSDYELNQKIYFLLRKNRRGITGLKFDYELKGQGGDVCIKNSQSVSK